MLTQLSRKCKTAWSKSKSRSSVRRGRGACRLALEALEDRVVPAIDFGNLKTVVGTFLNAADSGLKTYVPQANAALPIINLPLSGMQDASKTPLATLTIGTFEQAVLNALDSLNNQQTPPTDAQIAAALDAQLGPNGANVEGNNGQMMSEVHQKTAADPAGTPLIDIKLHLTKDLGQTENFFGLGVPSVPFYSTTKAKADLSFNLNLEFGLKDDVNNTFFVAPGELHLVVSANPEDPNPSGVMGFIYFQNATQNGLVGLQTPPGAGLEGVDFVFDVAHDPLTMMTNPLAAPKLSGEADINYHLKGSFAGAEISAPALETDLAVKWVFVGSQVNKSDHTFGNLSFMFKNVQVDFGSFLTQELGPYVKLVQEFTAPYKDFFELLGAPVPFISDLAKAAGIRPGISFLQLVGAANGAVVPPEWQGVVEISKDIIQVTNVLNKIQLDDNLQGSMLGIGDFDVVANQQQSNGPDIRDLISAITSGFKDPSADEWSAIHDALQAIPVKQLQAVIDYKLGVDAKPLSDALGQLKAGIESSVPNAASIKLECPLLDDPAMPFFDLLIGRDANLGTFAARADLTASKKIFTFNFSGFEVDLIGHISFDAVAKLGYDTYGLREMLAPLFAGQVPNPKKVFDGLYIDPSSYLKMDVGLTLQGGINATLLQAYVQGDLSAGINLQITPAPGGDGRIRWFSFTPDLFTVQGQITGSLNLDFKEGVDPFSLEQKITLAEGQIANFTIAGGINPFNPPDAATLGNVDDNGVLTLYMGPSAASRMYMIDNPNENFLITHADPKSDDMPGGEAVFVTAFGFTRRYSGVKKIYGVGGVGNDSVIVAADVGAIVELHGGAGNSTFEALGTGNASLFGGAGHDSLTGGLGPCTITGGSGNDTITGGSGNATLYAGDGNTTVQGGSGVNHIFGGAGQDQLVGGTGFNYIQGGSGAATLVAGPHDDFLTGGTGNSTLIAGAGHDVLTGGSGDNQFVWHVKDPANNILATDGPTEMIGGGNGNNRVNVYGGPGDDVFSVSKIFGDPQYDVQILASSVAAPNLVTPIKLRLMDHIDIEGGAGANQVTVNDLTGTRVEQVGVNLDDLLPAYFGKGDNSVDHIVVNATPNADNVTVKAELQQIQVPRGTEDQGIQGGVTTFSGLPNYKVLVANVNDDVTFNTQGGNDTINVFGITGPTLIRGSGGPGVSGNCTFNVTAQSTNDYATGLKIQVDSGKNALNVMQPGTLSDEYVVTQNTVTSNLLHTLSYVGAGGDFSNGVSLTTGDDGDKVQVLSTLPGVVTSITTGAGNDQVWVGAPGPSGKLGGIQGTLSVDLGGGANTLTLNNAGATSGDNNVRILPSKVLGFAGPAGTTPINYQASGGQMNLVLNGSNSAALSEHFYIANPNADLTLNTNAGDDRVGIVALTHSARINGGPGKKVVTVGAFLKNLDLITGPVSVFGNGGNVTLNVLDVAAAAGQTYTLTDTTLARSGAGTITFDNTLGRLNLSTAPFDDQVTVASMPVAQMVRLVGGGANNTLTGPDIDTLWDITGQNAGMLGGNVRFVNFQNLNGGAGNDHFVLEDGQGVSGTIDAGGGSADVLDYGPYTTPVVINLQTNTATNVGGFANFKQFTGGAAANTLLGPNGPNFWTVTGQNAGNINTLFFGVLQFASVENLVGGTSSDTFQIAPTGHLSGSITDPGGTNTIDYSQWSTGIVVDLLLGSATAIDGGIQGIDNVTGGNGNDILVGNANNNTLIDGNGRDILIGGKGNNVLQGGGGGNLVIGGYTAFDDSIAALSAIQAEWTRTDLSGSALEQYQTRIAHLMGAPGGLNGGVFLTNNTVFFDSLGTNQLTGGTGLDWFWAASVAEILDLESGERVN
jgi:Ca2+-binding RTX toxin-like protein